MVHFLFELINRFFARPIYYGSGVMRRIWRNVYSSAVFTGVDLFALKIYVDRVVLIKHSWHQKTRDTGLPDGEDRIPLRYLVLTQYWSVMDRQADRRTEGFAVAYTALAKLALSRCKNYTTACLVLRNYCCILCMLCVFTCV